MKRKFIQSGLLLGVILLWLGVSLPVCAAENASDVASMDVKLVINGEAIATNLSDGQPYITKSGRTMLPLRLIGETIHATVYYVNDTIVIEKPTSDYSASIKINNPRYLVNHQERMMDIPPVVRPEGRTYLPARAIAESFGEVEWDHATRTVTITSKLEEKRTHTTYPLNETLGYELIRGHGLTHFSDIYMARNNPRAHQQEGLIFPVPKDSEYRTQGIDNLLLKNVKKVPTGYVVAVEKSMKKIQDNGMDIFYDNLKSDTLVYAGMVVSTSDYTSDGTYLFSTDGLLSNGDKAVETHRLYVQAIGKPRQYAFFDVDCPINECTLMTNDGKLIATAPNGTVREWSIKDLLAKAGF